jgi:hypothetical protein
VRKGTARGLDVGQRRLSFEFFPFKISAVLICGEERNRDLLPTSMLSGNVNFTSAQITQPIQNLSHDK